MSYSVFCRATGRFRRMDTGLTIGDVFSLSDALNRIQTGAREGPTAVARQMLEDRAQNAGSGTSNLERGMQAIGRLHGLHAFREGLTYMLARKGRTWFEIRCSQRNTIFPDVSCHDEMMLEDRQDMPQRLLSRIWNELQDTDLTGGLVLASMGAMFMQYAEHRVTGFGDKHMYMLLDRR